MGPWPFIVWFLGFLLVSIVSDYLGAATRKLYGHKFPTAGERAFGGLIELLVFIVIAVKLWNRI